ncbi:MAG: hypothetical protein AAF694_01340 [Bacteroidota bacterium]
MENYVKSEARFACKIDIIHNSESTAFVFESEKLEKYFIGIHVGLILKGYLILLDALNKEGDFLSYLHSDIYKRVMDGSCVDTYEGHSVNQLINKFEVTAKTNVSQRYFELASSIMMQTLEFVLCHELSHIFRGHFSFLRNHKAPKDFSIIEERDVAYFFASNPSTKETEQNKVKIGIEADADMQAIFMGYNLLENEILDLSLTSDDFLDNIFIRSFSIGFLFLLIDNELAFEDQITGYPPSYWRLMFIQDYISHFNEIVLEIDKERVTNENVNALLEIENLAILLGYNKGRWIRLEEKNESGNTLEFASYVHYPIFEELDKLITDISEEIDASTGTCFIDGKAV